MISLTTDRLQLRAFTPGDAGFIVELLNSPGWLRFIGERDVHTIDDARRYLEHGPLASYRRHGFGLQLVTLRSDGTPVGMCGWLKRETMPDIELGFALLPAHTGRGYASEMGAALVARAAAEPGMSRVAAIAHPENAASIRVLEKLGFTFERLVRLPSDETELRLFGRTV